MRMRAQGLAMRAWPLNLRTPRGRSAPVRILAPPPAPAPMPDSSAPIAVIALSGRAMRYAEVQPGADGPRLRRLGTCDFDADAEAALFSDASDAASDAALSVVGDAIRDVFGGTEAQSLLVVAPATASTAFFTPLPSGMTDEARDEQIQQEAALLADVPPHAPVRVRAVPVRAEATAEGEQRWYHVVHVPERVHARLGRLADALGVSSYDIADTGRASAAVAQALAPGAGVQLVVGAYAAHTEAAVLRDGELLFGHHGPGATPEDTAYFALAALDTVGMAPTGADRLLVYGDAVAATPGESVPARLALLAQLSNGTPVALDGLPLFGRPVGGASAYDLAAFAPVLGAALGAS